ncbi:MAG: hypothetical protein AABW89_05885 [Nanoarchaeota archaeon]
MTKKIKEIAEYLCVSEDFVESTDSATLGEKILLKMLREGYRLESSNTGGGFAFYKDVQQKRN